MDVVLATARDHVDHSALTTAKLGRRCGGNYTKFLDRIVYLKRNRLIDA